MTTNERYEELEYAVKFTKNVAKELNHELQYWEMMIRLLEEERDAFYYRDEIRDYKQQHWYLLQKIKRSTKQRDKATKIYLKSQKRFDKYKGELH